MDSEDVSRWRRLKGDSERFVLLFMETSSIHGLGHMVAKQHSVAERVVWLLLVACAIGCATRVNMMTWSRYQESPTVIALEKTYRSWNTSLPSATVCPWGNYDLAAVRLFIDGLGSAEYAPSMEDFLTNLSEVAYGSFGQMEQEDDAEAFLAPERYLEAVLHNKRPFSADASNSHDLTNPPIVEWVSEHGVCYTYNTNVAMYNSPEYWETGGYHMLPPLGSVESNPLSGELIFAQLSRLPSAVKVFLHGPDEVADAGTRMYHLPTFAVLELTATPWVIYSAPETRQLSITQRRCRLLHESNLDGSPVYTYKMCRMECRRAESVRLCGCSPHLYRPSRRRSARGKMCDSRGLQCLALHEDRLVKLRDPETGAKLSCECLPPCDETAYVLEVQPIIPWEYSTNLKWSMASYPRVRYKRDVLFGMTDLLVSAGGTAGLFLGCSLLSFTELLYFFTLRLFWFLREKGRSRASKVRRQYPWRPWRRSERKYDEQPRN